jgi:uridine kinase
MNEKIVENPDIEKAILTIDGIIRNANKPILVALDGRSGSGKSTIAKIIAERLGGVEVKADDFWVGGANEEWDQRIPKEKAEMAIDWKRIRTEVLEPLLASKPASWHPFNWSTGLGLSSEELHSDPKPLIVLDGAYSSRPELQDIINLSILVEVPDDLHRRGRLVEREGNEYMKDWHDRWDVAEDYYFSEVRPKESFDMVISNH